MTPGRDGIELQDTGHRHHAAANANLRRSHDPDLAQHLLLYPLS